MGLGFLLWWLMAKVGWRLGVDRGRQPVRIALLLLLFPILLSLITFYFHSFTGTEASGVYRGMVYIGGLFGVTLVAADGIRSLERAHVLMRRIVHGVAAVAGVGVVEFVIGWRAGRDAGHPRADPPRGHPTQARSCSSECSPPPCTRSSSAACSGLALPVAVHYASVAPRKRRRLAWLEVALIAATIPLALSRTGVVAAVVGMGIYTMGWTWRLRRRALAILVVGLVALRVACPAWSAASSRCSRSSPRTRARRPARPATSWPANWVLQHPVVRARVQHALPGDPTGVRQRLPLRRHRTGRGGGHLHASCSSS